MLEFLLIPLIAVFIAPLFSPRAATAISGISFLIPFVYILYCLLSGITWEEGLIYISKPIGAFYLLNDFISYAFGLTICIVSAMVALYSLPYMKHRFEELEYTDDEFRRYFFLYNLYAVSMLWLVFCGNLIMLYIFLELSLLSSFLLIYLYGYGNRQWVAILYFVWTHIAGLLALIGFLFIMFDNGTAALNEIRIVSFIAWLLVFAGMLIKLPGVGPHIWLPWAHAEAPTPVSALLSPLTVGLGAYILLRIYQLNPVYFKSFALVILAYGVFSSIYAGLSVFKQTDYKRLLAYSTVSQMGYMLIGLALGTSGLIGVIIQYMSHAFGKSILFMTAGGLIALYHGLRDVNKMGGLHEQVPSISNVALIGFMNLSGILAIGMFGEFFILKGVTDVFGLDTKVLLSVVIVFIISGLYSFYVLRKIFYGTPREEYKKAKVHRFLDLPLYIIGLLSMLFIFPPLITCLLQGLKISLGLSVGGVIP